MFGSAATTILKMMGQSGNVPGALLAADIPNALESLKRELENQANEESGADTMDEDEDRPVSLHTRATPLIELFEAVASSNENVLWEEGRRDKPRTTPDSVAYSLLSRQASGLTSLCSDRLRLPFSR